MLSAISIDGYRDVTLSMGGNQFQFKAGMWATNQIGFAYLDGQGGVEVIPWHKIDRLSQKD